MLCWTISDVSIHTPEYTWFEVGVVEHLRSGIQGCAATGTLAVVQVLIAPQLPIAMDSNQALSENDPI